MTQTDVTQTDLARQIILTGSTLESTLARLAKLAEEALPGAHAGYTFVDEDQTCVRAAVFPSLPATFQDALAFTPLTAAGIAGVAQGDAGAASGLLNVSQQLGASLGLGILITVFASATRSAADHPLAGASARAEASN